jgi:hypothetical protein
MSNSIPSNGTNRRQLLARAGMVGAAAIGAGLLNSGRGSTAMAALQGRFGAKGHRIEINDKEILNFALNLEYLEAEFYARALTGTGLGSEDTGGKGAQGTITGGALVNFTDPLIAQYAAEIAADELDHVRFLRATLGRDAVAEPTIDLQNSFTAAAIAAGVITAGQTFDPFADEASFLLGAFIFEDVGVTAYHGAAPYIQHATYLSPAAGILAVEAYHASLVRTTLVAMGQAMPTLIDSANKISAARNLLSAAADDGTPVNPPNPETDQPITDANGDANIVPTDSNGIAFARTFAEVLNIVYLGGAANNFGFFPNKMNGKIA